MNIPIEPICGGAFIAALVSCMAALRMRRTQAHRLAELETERAELGGKMREAIEGALAARRELEQALANLASPHDGH